MLLAYLWLAFPFTLMVANSGANDALVPLLVLGALLAAARPAARGALVALAGLTKFAPLALAPLFAAYRPRRLSYAIAFAAVVAVALAPFDLSAAVGPHARLPAAARLAVLGLGPLRAAGRAPARRAAARGGLRGRRRVPAPAPRSAALAALAAAVLIALQLAADHWFYLYVVWFAPLMWVALLAGPARSSPPAAAATPGSAPR